MTLVDAWRAWFDGQMDLTATLWGVQLFWWGRLGKALQLVGGLTILVDIIGSDRMRAFGVSLHHRITIAYIRENIRHLFEWLTLMFSYYFTTKPPEEEKRRQEKLQTYKAQNISIFIALGVLIYSGFFMHISDSWFWQALAAFGLFFITGMVLAPVAVLLATLLLFALGVALDVIVIEPIAWVLERKRFDKLVKLFAFVTLLIGFHFDFLAT